jgi:hypothetical protein
MGTEEAVSMETTSLHAWVYILVWLSLGGSVLGAVIGSLFAALRDEF